MWTFLSTVASAICCCKKQQQEEEGESIELQSIRPENRQDRHKNTTYQRPVYKETECDSDVKLLESQASDHTMILCNKNRHVMQACAEREAKFYENMPLILAPAVPKCCVTLTDGKRVRTRVCCKPCFRENSSPVFSVEDMEEIKALSRCALIMQNLTAGFKKPSVLDLKLGTRRHGDGASREKLQKKTMKCTKSTSAALGVRLGGMRKYKKSKKVVTMDKLVGRQLDAEGLQEVFRTFFKGCKKVDIVKEKIVKIKKIIEMLLYLRLYGSSLRIIIESSKSKKYRRKEPQVKIVDFEKVSLKGFSDSEEHPGVDFGTIKGLSSILKMLDSL